MTAQLLESLSRRLMAPETKRLTTDVETTGLSWHANKSCGYVLTFSPDPRDSFYLPIGHKTGPNLDRRKVTAMLAKAAKRQDLRWEGHNLAFDLKFEANDGILPAGPLEDSMINAPLVNEYQRYSLEECCKNYGVQPKQKDQIIKRLRQHADATGREAIPDKQLMGLYWELPADDPVAVDYAVGDGTSTRQLIDAQQEQLDAQGLRRVWAVECRMIRVLDRMSRRGIRVDEELFAQVNKHVIMLRDAALHRLPDGFNVRASSQLKELFAKQGINGGWPMTAPSRTFPQGQPSFNDAWLKTFPLGLDILAVRKFDHLLNSFFVPLLERHIINGLVHTSFNQLKNDEFGTITGRLSSNDPNMQQVHKRNKELGVLFRLIFKALAGMVWGSADYEQIEPRLLAIYGNVKVLIDGFLADPPLDPHMAVTIAADIRDIKGALDRESGKRINQGLLTGMGRSKTALQLGRPPSEANAIVDAYFRAMPEISRLQRTAADRMKANGYVMSLLGRRARLDDVRFAYRAVNRLLQCGNADIIKLKMCELEDYHESIDHRVQMILQTHDSLDFQFEEGARKEYDESLRIMTSFGEDDVIKLKLPMPVDSDVGESWAHATYGAETVDKILKGHKFVMPKRRKAA